jgi:sulfotransferase family protein
MASTNARRRGAADPFRPARWVELAGRVRPAISDRSPIRLDATDLRRRASRRLGRTLDNDDPGLEVLVADAAAADLTDLGRLAVRAQLLRRIVTAEALHDSLARWPVLGDVELPHPIVIVGLPRSGTTLLHHLLACDPGAVAPRFWQLLWPAPPPSSSVDRGVRFVRAGLTVYASRAMLPRLDDIHRVTTSQPEECNFLFRDIAMYAVPFPAFGYLRWVQGGAAAAEYGGYRRRLQVLLSSQSGRRPVLKSPFHLGHLDELLAALPDALMVHTHRAPTSALASWCSLVATISRGTAASIALGSLGQHWLDYWARAAARALEVRDVADRRRFQDVRYADLIADPLREVRRIYAAAELDLMPIAEQRMERWLERHHRNRRSRPRADLALFGLSEAAVTSRFVEYASL